MNERWSEGSRQERAAAVKARAWVLLGTGYRLAQEYERAEALFRTAAFHLTGPPDSLERAFFCRHLAALRQEQGRSAEAVALLWRAARIYRQNGAQREEGWCLAQLGAGEEGRLAE